MSSEPSSHNIDEKLMDEYREIKKMLMGIANYFQIEEDQALIQNPSVETLKNKKF